MMPDITCCPKENSKNEENTCPLRDNCYRYTVMPDRYMQSYFADPPYDKEKKACKYHWTNEPPEAA